MTVYELNYRNIESFFLLNPVCMVAFLTGPEGDSESIYERMTMASEIYDAEMGFGIVSTIEPKNIGLCRACGVGLTSVIKYFVDGYCSDFMRVGASEILRGLTESSIDQDFNLLASQSKRIRTRFI